jgi:DNA-binding HxlR family transcriptional regulator
VVPSGAVALPREYETQACALARSLEIVGERWTLLILRDLFFGVRRFSDLQAHLDVPRAVLSTRLARLVSAGIVERRPYASGRDELLLTDSGLELWPIVHRLMQWGERHLVDDGPVRLFSHATCGTDLSPHGDCPACGTEPAPAEIETRPGPGVPTVVRRDPITRALRRPHRLLTPVTA